MKRRPYPGASAYTDRHGKRRWRYQAKGFRAELGTEYGSDDFIRRYEAAVNRKNVGAGSQRTAPGTFNALCASWYRSPDFLNLANVTKGVYRNAVEKLRERYGHCRVATIKRRNILDMMAEKADTPNAANFILRMMRQTLAHAVDLEWRPDNPAHGIKRYTFDTEGFHSWSEDEIERYYAAHPAGTLAHTAITLMLYTGAARGDACRMGWGNVSEGRLTYRRGKTGVRVDMPVHDDLAAVLATLPRDAFTFLQTRAGRSRSPNGLGNLMREWCDEAGLPDCTAHGLRKAVATRLAQAGATPHQIQSITGHKTLSEVERYTRAVEGAGLADTAMGMIPARSKGEQTLANHPMRFAKSDNKPLKRKDKK